MFRSFLEHAERNCIHERMSRHIRRPLIKTYMSRWPEGFCNIGGWSFQRVFDEKKDFVEFTMTCMEKPSGMFAEWKAFCELKTKDVINIERSGSKSPPQ